MRLAHWSGRRVRISRAWLVVRIVSWVGVRILTWIQIGIMAGWRRWGRCVWIASSVWFPVWVGVRVSTIRRRWWSVKDNFLQRLTKPQTIMKNKPVRIATFWGRRRSSVWIIVWINSWSDRRWRCSVVVSSVATAIFNLFKRLLSNQKAASRIAGMHINDNLLRIHWRWWRLSEIFLELFPLPLRRHFCI